MRNDSRRWAALRDRSDRIEAPGVTIEAIACERLTLLSGPRVLQTDLPLAEWSDVTKAETYALSLRRDRVLEVNGPARADGWDSRQNMAISDVTDGYAQVKLTGPNALDLIRRGTEIDLNVPSRSVARLFFGLGVFLYRHGHEDTYRIHIQAAQDETLWAALNEASKHLT